MSESAPTNRHHESANSPEIDSTAAGAHEISAQTHDNAPEHHHDRHNHQESARKAVEAAALSTDETNKAAEQHADTPQAQPVLGVQQALKTAAYKNTLRRVQSELPPMQRTFSKFIHNPTVDTVSDVSSKTIARSVGTLGGAITALLGSIGLLFYSKHYGFTYNYAIIFGLFLAGYLIATLLEGVYRLVRHPRP